MSHRCKKIEAVITPRVQSLPGPAGGLSPKAIRFISRPTLDEALVHLERIVAECVGPVWAQSLTPFAYSTR
jgi:hypothetical protein